MAFGINVTSHPFSDNTGMKLQSYSKTPRAESTADAIDEEGDVAARTYYGGNSAMLNCSASYEFVNGSCPTSIKLGYDSSTGATRHLLSLAIGTSNSGYPTYDVTWIEGYSNVAGNSYTITLPTVLPKRIAQTLAITVGTGAKLQSSGVSYTVDLSEATDEKAEYAAAWFSHCTAEATADAVAVTSDPSFTAESGWTLEETGGLSESPSAYGTSSVKASRFVAADTTSN